MPRLLFLPSALLAGFLITFLSAGVHSTFIVLLPALAFLFGYAESWWYGLICGFLLLAGSSFGGALLWWGGGPNLYYPLQYIASFILGGFTLPLLGSLAPMVRTNPRSMGSAVALTVAALFVLGSLFLSVRPNGFYYQVAIASSADLGETELYLPVGTISGKPYEGLLSSPYYLPRGGTTQNYDIELVETEYGPMLKVAIHGLETGHGPRGLPYSANLIFMQRMAFSWGSLHLKPKLDAVSVGDVRSRYSLGPFIFKERRTAERFSVPMLVESGAEAQIQVTVRNRTDGGSIVAFGFGKSRTYTELLRYGGPKPDGWVMVPVEATYAIDIRGVGD